MAQYNKTEQLIKANGELKQTKDNLFKSLNEELGNIKATKTELEKYQQALKDKNIEQDKIDKYVADYPINKKLQFILHEIGLHEQLDTAIEFLDKTLLYIGALNDNTQKE